jgi:hypothetical protein
MSLSRAGLILILVLAAFSVGWLVGASGRASVALARDEAIRRADESALRACVLAGRVKLYAADFGDARRLFQQARAIATHLQRQWRETLQADRAGRVEIVIAHLIDADRRASAMDVTAHTAASDALTALDAVDPATP